MKLIGVALDGVAEVARALPDGKIDLLATREDFWAAPEQHLRAARAADSRDAVALHTRDVVPIVPPSARVFCVGLNYRAHVAEGSYRDLDLPDHPTIFGRWTQSLTAGDAPVEVPDGEDGLDWEGEIAAYVGSTLRDVTADTARAAVLGYSTFNDLTARRAQKLTSQWTLGKNADGSGPLGPLVTADEVGDLRDGLALRTYVNDELVQEGDTRDQIFELGEVLSFISRTLTLHPGDVVATGTPEGVGYARTPPWLLRAGDVVEVRVERLGSLRTPVVARRTTTAGPGIDRLDRTG